MLDQARKRIRCIEEAADWLDAQPLLYQSARRAESPPPLSLNEDGANEVVGIESAKKSGLPTPSTALVFCGSLYHRCAFAVYFPDHFPLSFFLFALPLPLSLIDRQAARLGLESREIVAALHGQGSCSNGATRRGTAILRVLVVERQPREQRHEGHGEPK